MKKNFIAAALVTLAACTSLPAVAQTESQDDHYLNETTTTTVETTTPANPMLSTNVAALRPFSPEANFMSLSGVYRYLTFVNTGVWMTRGEAVATVDSQIEAAAR